MVTNNYARQLFYRWLIKCEDTSRVIIPYRKYCREIGEIE